MNLKELKELGAALKAERERQGKSSHDIGQFTSHAVDDMDAGRNCAVRAYNMYAHDLGFELGFTLEPRTVALKDLKPGKKLRFAIDGEVHQRLTDHVGGRIPVLSGYYVDYFDPETRVIPVAE